MGVALAEVVAVYFTWSWRGFGLRYADGREETFPVELLEGRVGPELAARYLEVATAGIGTGCWRSYPSKGGFNFADA